MKNLPKRIKYKGQIYEAVQLKEAKYKPNKLIIPRDELYYYEDDGLDIEDAINQYLIDKYGDDQEFVDWQEDKYGDIEINEIQWSSVTDDDNKNIKTAGNRATVNITSVELLSVKEAEKIPVEIRIYTPSNYSYKNPRDWWLQDIGDKVYWMAYVDDEGTIDPEGGDWDHEYCVRPAFTIPDLKSLNLNVGDKIFINDIECVVISDNKALYNDYEIESEYENTGDMKSGYTYDKSYIKKLVQRKFGKYLGKQELKY